MAKLPVKTANSLLSATDAYNTRIHELAGVETFTIETRGRPPKWDWERAAISVFGSLNRGEVPKPRSQADVERLLVGWFSAKHAREPSEKAIRGHARLIWEEVRKGQ
jgi:hypothetical protein